MHQPLLKSRMFWLTLGLVGGLCLAYFRPQQEALALATDRSAKYAILTTPVGPTDVEGVFILDFLTGQLQGHVLHPRAGKFVAAYYRNLTEDFDLDVKTEAQWAIVAGLNKLSATEGITWGESMIYVSELVSGRMIAYAFPRVDSHEIAEPLPLEKIDGIQFRPPLPVN